MKLTEIILSKYAPQNLRAVWLHPSDTGIEVFIYNNGKWEEISVLNKSGGSVTIGSKDSEFTIIAKDSKVHIQDQNGNVYQVITTETSVGQKTSEGGEIFNDYKNNAAGASYAHAEGQKTIASGNSSHAEGVGTKATNANSHSEGNQTTASGSSSHSEGYSTTASGGYSHAEGNGTQATANAAHAEGTNTVASAQNAHAEGQSNTADAAQAHVEGVNNTAHGQNSHAEGNGNTVNGNSSHVEGYDNTAEGSYCHVEGGHNTASGSGSHAEGIGTQATNEGEHAEGRYNISNNGGTNASRTVHSVGVGTSSAKRNAHEIMWSGDHYIYGLGGYDGTNYADAQTLQEVINGKQGSTDNTLQTTSKTITGAINELFSSKQNNITPGTGLAFDGNTLNVTLDTTVFRVVSSLPDSPAAGDENKIFLVPAESTGTNNAYTEYLWVNSAWEELGQYISEVDLTSYLRITDAQSTYATKTELTAHTGDISNPHNVTKAQVGLGNVDNTSDDNKPVSTAQQAALDLKQNASDNTLETDNKTVVGAINEVNTKVNSISDVFNQLAYGVEWTDSQTSPDLTRIGNPDFHRTLPIQSALRGCIGTKDGISYYLDADNWAYKEDGSASVLDGTDGDICIEVPRFYLWSESDNGTNRVWISTTRLVPYAMEVPHMLVTAERCSVDRTGLKFRSIVNTAAQFRGGDNNSSFDQYLDTDPYRTLLGKPATDLSLATAHTYAEASGGEVLSYDLYKAICYWLFVIEYATFNSQKAYNGELTSEGYHQGGLGNGVTDINFVYWTYYNSNYPLTPCGFTNDLGNGTGIKQMTVITPVEKDGEPTQTYNFQVPRWRGFTNPFGDIWTVVSGAYIVRTGADTTEFWRGTSIRWDNAEKTGKLFLGSLANANGYIAKFRLGNQADIVPEITTGATILTHMCDYYYGPNTSMDQYNQPRTLTFGGDAHSGANAGLGYFACDTGASHSNSYGGFRMVYRLD